MACLTGLPAFASPEFCAPLRLALPLPGVAPQWLKAHLMSLWSVEVPCLRCKSHAIVRLPVQGYTTQPQLDPRTQTLTTERAP